MEKKYQFIFMIILFIFLTFLSFLFSPFFHIRNFIFHSRDNFNKNNLRKSINQFYGNNLLFLDEEELKVKLLEHNLISEVKIEKNFPSKVHIIIETRKGVAWINNNGQKFIFSADGIIIEQKKNNFNVDLPKLEGFAYYFEDDKIKLPLASQAILDVLNKFEIEFLAKMKKITYQDNVFKLYLSNGSGVNLGQGTKLEEKFAILNSILNKQEENKIDYINLQVIKHPVIKLK
ncbi:cell division protein FtsQ/DivIB [Halanaerobium praevalens]|uniref:Polypeptide-transport-associated domain protein FtsQ-type n=1 Tax=Halanaerobium praevalens (strain ATCC 33744 / DSM 2228 / GSL) TaxID=572479 RepID=E3DQH9_HALPG|nr:cell division protein FtsQ/DivIB [Halanaerobium praevalens]ADO76875.1 Polypeptide-transport-associated domain protein FtsQ-type [Halanaerobium praevalens DSM 2228]